MTFSQILPDFPSPNPNLVSKLECNPKTLLDILSDSKQIEAIRTVVHDMIAMQNELIDHPDSALLNSAAKETIEHLAIKLNTDQVQISSLFLEVRSLEFLFGLPPVHRGFALHLLNQIQEATENYQTVLGLTHDRSHKLSIAYERSLSSLYTLVSGWEFPQSMNGLEHDLPFLLSQISNEHLSVQINSDYNTVIIPEPIFVSSYHLHIPRNIHAQKVVLDVHQPAHVVVSSNSHIETLIANGQSQILFADESNANQFFENNPQFQKAKSEHKHLHRLVNLTSLFPFR